MLKRAGRGLGIWAIALVAFLGITQSASFLLDASSRPPKTVFDHHLPKHHP